jgi:hypothetical protein
MNEKKGCVKSSLIYVMSREIVQLATLLFQVSRLIRQDSSVLFFSSCLFDTILRNFFLPQRLFLFCSSDVVVLWLKLCFVGPGLLHTMTTWTRETAFNDRRECVLSPRDYRISYLILTEFTNFFFKTLNHIIVLNR